MSSAREDALLAHVVSQITTNVDFLVSQNYISHIDARNFINKLPASASGTVSPAPAVRASPVASPPPSVPSPASSKVSQGRALWPYNVNGEDPDDLSFNEGDVIDIIEETNADWWLGRFNGKEALFPSSYVEKIAATNGPARRVPPNFSGAAASTAPAQRPAYRPFGAAHHGYDKPPPTTTNSVGLQHDAAAHQAKQDKMAPYKNTLAHSAVGGVGFGAGSAIGGGLVRAIF
ncbi:SH3-domain-containing protein [Flagelloscypha sp. PMI_526]|nr:SH3-domain-containing protein [Flagelloscypha sp. PMI_526]